MNDGKWVKGQSGNPTGRPPRSRVLTELLEAAGDREVRVGDEVVTGKDLLARMVWDFVTTGKVTLPDGRNMRADSRDWVSVMEWLYKHVDGSKTEVEIGTDAELENIIRVVVHGQTSSEEERNGQDDTRVQTSDN